MAEPAEREIPAGDTPALPRADMIALLAGGELSVEGRLMDASNATLFCFVEADGVQARCVYKPIRGERPLWDFPDGTLAAREVGAYELSAALPWDIVPPTVMRDGPFGTGMVQLWIDVDEGVDLGDLVRSDRPELRRTALFDVVVNNADRKGGHLLPTPAGHVHGIDHGLCYHVEDKLRTVLWTFRGRRLSGDEVDALSQLRALLEGPLADDLSARLTRAELAATISRLDRLLGTGRFPQPSGEWPALPWPPF